LHHDSLQISYPLTTQLAKWRISAVKQILAYMAVWTGIAAEKDDVPIDDKGRRASRALWQSKGLKS
jgi:hypothetical protein